MAFFISLHVVLRFFLSECNQSERKVTGHTTNWTGKFPVKKAKVQMGWLKLCLSRVWALIRENQAWANACGGLFQHWQPQRLTAVFGWTLSNLDLFFLLIRNFSLDPLDHPHCDLPPRSPPGSSVFLTCILVFCPFAWVKGLFHFCQLPFYLNNMLFCASSVTSNIWLCLLDSRFFAS